MKNKNTKKMFKRILISAFICIALVIIFFIATNAITKYTGFSVLNTEDDDFKNCLKEKDITLFINSENPLEILKNIEFSEYLDDIKIMNCLRNNKICLEKEIRLFPSWVINNNKFERDISILELSEFSGCRLLK